MFGFPKRTSAKKSEDALPRRTDSALGKLIAEIMDGIGETLGKSCLYFPAENLAVLGSAPDITALLERLDPLIRAALLDGTLRPEQQLKFRSFAEGAGNLKAAAEAARLAAQIFRLLHDSGAPVSVLAPLKKVTDSALRTLRTSASAIVSSDEQTARTALKSFAETEAISREVTEIIPTLPDYCSPTLCRLIAAALYAILVSAQSIAEVSAQLVLPTPAKIEPLEKLEFLDPFPVMYQGNAGRQDEVICMPATVKSRKG